MTYTYICPTCLARQGTPVGGKLVSQEIGGCMACLKLEAVYVYWVGKAGLPLVATSMVGDGIG
jgi:hypothetical protein